MGFYIRKSVRVGPLRFNLSTSGIGVSTGIPGLRVGAGPRGTYIRMGAGGLYYRQTLSPPTPRRRNIAHHVTDLTVQRPATHGPIEGIGSCSATEMVDVDSTDLLSEIQRKRRRLILWPFLLIASLAVGLLLQSSEASLWIKVPSLLMLFVALVLVHQYDQLRKSVVLMYDLDGPALESYRYLFAAVDEIARCGAVWHVTARGAVYDPKYHAGAGQLINRKLLDISYRDPPHVKTNLPVPCLPLGRITLYLLPDRILAYDNNGVGSVGYDSLQVAASPTRFIEDSRVPRDAVVVDHTWRYVNKNGGPDRRFNNNSQLPICHYEELVLSSSSGLREVIHLSRLGVSSYLESGIAASVRSIQIAEQAEEERRRLEEQQRLLKLNEASAENATVERLNEIAFDVMCCIMAADGRASGSEKAVIREVMGKLNSGWSDEECDERLTSFIGDARNDGYASIVKRAMSQIPIFKQTGKGSVLLKCINLVASADGKRSQREQDLCNRIRKALEDTFSDRP